MHNWSISKESLYATIHSIVTNQINPRNGQVYFPFIYTLFIFILINNLIGMVKRGLEIIFLFILNNLIYGPSLAFELGSEKSKIKAQTCKMYSLLSYSQIKSLKDQIRYSFNNNNTFYLNPDYITGFIDGEGCFTVSVYKDSRALNGWQAKAIFCISLHKKEIKLLEAIQRTLNVGKIYKHGSDSLQYRVSSLSNLQVIIDHLEKYPLITQKQADYLLFKEAVNLLKNKKHLSPTGLLELLGIKAALNWGLSEKFKESFPEVVPANRPKVELSKIRNFNWIRGFVEAEGSFQVVIQKIKDKSAVSLRFTITQHSRDEKLLKDIVTYLNCGRYYKTPNRNEGQYMVTDFSNIYGKIIPLFKEYPLIGNKKEDYLDFVRVAELIKSKEHLTEEGLEKIKLIQNNMNKKRI